MGGIEFLHTEKVAPIDIHRHLLNVYGDETVDVSIVRWWVVHFSKGDSKVKTSHIPDDHAGIYEQDVKALVH